MDSDAAAVGRAPGGDADFAVRQDEAAQQPEPESAAGYREAFKAMLWAANIQALVIIALVGFFAFYVNFDEKKDRYFAETMESRQMQMTGLDSPNMGRVALANWVSQAATQIMTFGFNDIDQQFALSRNSFSERGWKNFYNAMVKSGLADNVIKAQQIVTAIPESTPILLQEGLIMDRYSWVYKLRLLITFRSGGEKQTIGKNVRVVVEKVPTRENPSGIGIGEWYIY